MLPGLKLCHHNSSHCVTCLQPAPSVEQHHCKQVPALVVCTLSKLSLQQPTSCQHDGDSCAQQWAKEVNQACQLSTCPKGKQCKGPDWERWQQQLNFADRQVGIPAAPAQSIAGESSPA